MVLRSLYLLTALLLVPGCGVALFQTRDDAAAPSVQLVDSIPWENELGEGFLRRVEVRIGSRVDTLPGVLTSELPVVSPESVLSGFAYEADGITAAYAYDARRRRFTWLRLPEDFNPYYSAPSISPDARHLAYVIVPGNSTASASVRSWPGRRLVWRSDTVQIPATDARDLTLTRWISPDSSEAYIATGVSTGDAWYRVLGSVRAGAVLQADSVWQSPFR